MPQVLPWLAILALLMLKPNRCASAWWILVPLACVGGLAFLPESLLEHLPFDQFELYLETIGALGFGLAAAWLLSGYLAWKHRVVACLGMLAASGAFGLFSLVPRLDWGNIMVEVLQAGFFLGMGALVTNLALTLAGLFCRGKYCWLRLSLWLMVALLALWLVLIGPFFLLGVLASGLEVPLLSLFPIVGVAAGLTFCVILPFLVLSFVNGFYRERLKGLLHLGSVAPPPIITPPMPALQEVAGG